MMLIFESHKKNMLSHDYLSLLQLINICRIMFATTG